MAAVGMGLEGPLTPGGIEFRLGNAAGGQSQNGQGIFLRYVTRKAPLHWNLRIHVGSRNVRCQCGDNLAKVRGIAATLCLSGCPLSGFCV